VELSENRLPQSLLFYGPPYAGKLSTALELARVLTCDYGTAEWNCGCTSCEKQRLLIHPNTMMLGSRYFLQEIAACADVFKRTGKTVARYMLLRAVRKLERRFDDILWEKAEGKIQKVYPLLQEIEDSMEGIQPNGGNDNVMRADTIEKRVQLILNNVEQITRTVNLENIPIDSIRSISMWAHTTSSGSNKIVIIENSHKMLESARNALLKILEEPPRGVYFILLSPRKSSLISTILSRLRHYYFVQRDTQQSALVLEKIFREASSQYSTLEEYFHAWMSINKELIDKSVNTFMQSVLSGDVDRILFWGENDHVSQLKEKEQMRLFLNELSIKIKSMLHHRSFTGQNRTVMQSVIEKWAELIRQTSYNIDIYNQQSQLALEYLYHKMRMAL
jgi:DNA polymerase-3 subunit gamma/tau